MDSKEKQKPATDVFIHLMTKDILNTKPLKIDQAGTRSSQNLTKQNNIIIEPADKGKAIVIMDTEKYNTECYWHLNNSKFYKRLPKDKAHQIKDSIHICLKMLPINDKIEENTHNYLLPHRSHPARFHITPKIHKNKDNSPSQPIVSAFSHSTECISEFIDYQLNPLIPKLPSYIKDTTQLDSLPELPNGCLLVTLDVSSLCTKISTKKEFAPAEKLSNHKPTVALKPNPYVT